MKYTLSDTILPATTTAQSEATDTETGGTQEQ